MLRIIAETADVIGKVLVSYTALAVHHRVRHEHKIDQKVFTIMRAERVLGFVGISLMILAYIFHLLDI